MSNATIIFLLTICIVILVCIIVYQQFVFHNGTKAKIHEISSKLEELLDTGSDEKVTVFTDNKALIELATQINRMLEDRQKVKVEYRRTEMASKKMLSNISHDIKTPRCIQCLSPAKKYKLYKSSINKSLHFAQRSLNSSTRG